MFGYVMASLKELEKPRRNRYSAVYCGICRSIRSGSSNLCRCCLSYDMALLALVLMLPVVALGEAVASPSADAFTSASVADASSGRSIHNTAVEHHGVLNKEVGRIDLSVGNAVGGIDQFIHVAFLFLSNLYHIQKVLLQSASLCHSHILLLLAAFFQEALLIY